MDQETKVKNQAAKIKELEEVLANQRRQLSRHNDALREKNRALDAMHYVWCDGGCMGGVHRFKEMESVPVTEELVRKAEDSVIRLRTWFINKQYRDGNRNKYLPSLYWRFILWLAKLRKHV